MMMMMMMMWNDLMCT